MKKFYVISYSITIILLLTIIIIGTAEIIGKHQKYGYTYTTTTITGTKIVETTISLPMNLSFILFMSWITLLLLKPLITHIKTNKNKKCDNGGEKNER